MDPEVASPWISSQGHSRENETILFLVQKMKQHEKVKKIGAGLIRERLRKHRNKVYYIQKHGSESVRKIESFDSFFLFVLFCFCFCFVLFCFVFVVVVCWFFFLFFSLLFVCLFVFCFNDQFLMKRALTVDLISSKDDDVIERPDGTGQKRVRARQNDSLKLRNIFCAIIIGLYVIPRLP